MSFRLFHRFALDRWALIPVRLIVGFGFMQHGFAKLTSGPDAFANILQALGVPGPHFIAWSTILVEILGGLAVILGAFVRLASLPMAAVLLVAMFTVHLPYGFSSIKLQAVTAAGAQFGPPGYEVDLLYLACLAALVLGGPGPLAIDGLIRKRRKVRSSQSTPHLTTTVYNRKRTNAANSEPTPYDPAEHCSFPTTVSLSNDGNYFTSVSSHY